MFAKAFLLCSLAIVSVCEVDGKKIVFFHVIAGYSHRTQTWSVAEALAKQGHEVTYITSMKPLGTNPNITELTPKSVNEMMEELINGNFDVSLRAENKMVEMHNYVFDMALAGCGELLKAPEFLDWLKVNKKFDLFVIDNTLNECGIGLAKYLGAKAIIFSTILPFAYEYDALGFLPMTGSIPEMAVYIPDMPMGFFERVYNTYLTLIWRWKHYWYTFKIDELLKQLPNSNLPPVGELMRNISLVFYTGDVISDYPRSLPPLFVNVAGTHVRDSTQELPKKMELFLNSTKNDGFVYISLGSVVIPANLPEEVKQTFFETMRAFPTLKFFWRWSGGEIPKDIPENLFLSKWFPQIDILAHPKIKGFVTQNGRPSTLEALYHGVPMISFPVLGDQDLNAHRLSEMGGSIKLDIVKVTPTHFKDAIRKVVYDSSMKNRMTTLQDIFRNRPMSPIQTALWWIDYVLKYEDTEHLRTAGYDQYWFVRRQVDVWAFVSITAFITVAGVVLITSKIINYMLVKETKLKRA